jgi:hypothetical protein
MLSSSSPVGEASRRQRWWLTATAHLVGSVLGGATVGAVLGGAGWALSLPLGSPTTRTALTLLATAAAVGVLVDLSRFGPRLPAWRCQVDERWLTSYRGWVYGGGYGLQLGAGAVTLVPATTTYLTGLAALLTTSPGAGALVGATFGALRAVPLLLTARLRDPARLTRTMRRVSNARRTAQLTTAGGQAAIAVVALAWVVTA